MAPATPQAAAAFARFFYAQITRAYETNDPSLIQRLSASGCKACQRYVASVRQARDQHERVTGVEYKIRFAEAPALQGSAARVDVIYDAPATRRYADSGQLLETEPAVTGYKTELMLVRTGSSWQVVSEQQV